MPKPFRSGTVVVFEPKNFNPAFWNQLSEADRKKYYGPLGYKSKKPKLFVFLCPIYDADGDDSGHCCLVDLDDGHIEKMRHTGDFRKATDKEF